MLRRAFAYVREQGTLARLLVLSADPSSAQTARQATRAQIVAALAHAFAEWSARGLVRPLDPQIAAELLFALVDAALIACFVRGGGAREEDYLREVIRCVEGAVLPRPDLPPSPPRAPRSPA
jgi:AcrR family transcriptional regulator